MDYFIVRSDQLLAPVRDKLIESNRMITSQELLLMNTSARMEYLKGNKQLNDTLIRATDELAQEELQVRMESDQ